MAKIFTYTHFPATTQAHITALENEKRVLEQELTRANQRIEELEEQLNATKKRDVSTTMDITILSTKDGETVESKGSDPIEIREGCEIQIKCDVSELWRTLKV